MRKLKKMKDGKRPMLKQLVIGGLLGQHSFSCWLYNYLSGQKIKDLLKSYKNYKRW
jgi:hypothetical protein